jgi:hypothetical protein
VADTLWGYAVFAVGILAIIVVMTAIGAWWLRWSATRYFGWVPPEPKNPRRSGSEPAGEQAKPKAGRS